ncbi:histidine phosphatase family protein [Candidatus Gottesmanbacteria bacterium]|nr:histidine phosphatase family protein [Candidatus Gottesmanbacteria bacterium]
MAKIYLVRHAESIANTQGIYQGITYDTGLSQRGKTQAKALAARFCNVAIDSITSSSLKRTYDTAACVAAVKGIPHVHIEESIKETNHGEWEGKSKNEIMKRWPKLYRKWEKFPSRVSFPSGERFVDTQRRVLLWWRTFCTSDSGNTLIVTHDNIVRIIVGSVLHMKLNKIWSFHLQPTAVTEIEIVSGEPHIRTLNDAHHIGTSQVNLAAHAL